MDVNAKFCPKCGAEQPVAEEAPAIEVEVVDNEKKDTQETSEKVEETSEKEEKPAEEKVEIPSEAFLSVLSTEEIKED